MWQLHKSSKSMLIDDCRCLEPSVQRYSNGADNRACYQPRNPRNETSQRSPCFQNFSRTPQKTPTTPTTPTEFHRRKMPHCAGIRGKSYGGATQRWSEQDLVEDLTLKAALSKRREHVLFETRATTTILFGANAQCLVRSVS